MTNGPVAGPATTGTASPTAPHLRGRQLLLARLVWGALIGLTLALYVASLPVYYARLQVICASAVACAMGGALTADGMAAIGRIGITPQGYALYTVALFGVVIVIWAAVGFLIFWRRSDEWIGLIGSFFLIAFNPGVREGATYALPLAHPAWDVPVKLVNGISIGSVVLFFFCFPDGRIVPRWMRWPVVAIVVLVFITIFAPANSLINTDTGNPWLDDAIFLGILVAIALTQIYRYRRVSGPVERQQVKWALFGMACALIGLFCLGLAPAVVPAFQSAQGPFEVLSNTIYPLVLLSIPIFIAVAILRSRLWGIDVIIRRTLIYGTLTVILAALYFAVVLAAQVVGERLTGQTQPPPWLIVVTTLAIAALFTPLRRKVQMAIDHRFYRRRYDATRTVEAFAATLRSELDLRELHEHLVSVVAETMQPQQVTLWLHSSSANDTRRA